MTLYRNNLKNRNFGKEGSQNLYSERGTIAERQGPSENANCEANSTWPKTDSSGCFGICKIGARDSALSRAQVQEVLSALQGFYPEMCFETVFVQTRGDKDLETSLRWMERSDFFTQELDEMLLRKEVAATVHSAKDLPDPLPSGLKLAALTQGVNPADVLVCRLGESLDTLPVCARIGTSSLRREKQIASWRPHWTCVDIRGTIESRLDQLEQKRYDAVVMAKAALIRLNYVHYPHWELKGESAPLQGRLAVLVRSDDEEMAQLFSVLERS